MVYYLIKCILGQSLIRLYRTDQSRGHNYIPNSLEHYSNTIIQIFHGFCVLCKWTSPVILAIAYNRGYLTVGYLYSICKLMIIFSSFITISYLTRGIGRYLNPEYKAFLIEYLKLNQNQPALISERKLFLSKYDFSLDKWSPEFYASKKPPIFKNKAIEKTDSIIEKLKFLSWDVLSSICVNTFGLRMMYPGVLIQNLIKPMLIEGRSKIIEEKKAIRALIQTNDRKNLLDTVFIDQRNKNAKHGNDLVICTDGNASFYEVGIFGLPIEKGYSVLGWNYPGFAQSTGLPYPDQITSSADAIMQYAFSLGFKPENIILFSWSIGGFPTSWLAINYPEVKAVILDACFDDILHLAKEHLPKFASTFVEYAVNTNLNLNILELVKNYSGPVRLIRRTQDEIVSIIPRIPATNRGNDLLIGILKKRYPHVITSEAQSLIRIWLSAKSEVERISIYEDKVGVNKDAIEIMIKSYIEEYSLHYPLNIGHDINDELKHSMALYLANKYLINFESSHCQPLPKFYLKQPWSELDLLNGKSEDDSFVEKTYF